MDKDLRRACEQNPETEFQVVITLRIESEHDPVLKKELAHAEAIGAMGIYKGLFTGKKLLELALRPEIEEIVHDFEVDHQ